MESETQSTGTSSSEPSGQRSTWNPGTSKVVAVTGGYGFLGSAVTEELESRGHFVLRGTSKEYDLRNFADAEEFLIHRNADVLVHLAAFVGGIQKNIDHPAEMMYDNLRMGINVVEQARRHGVKHLVMIGTACSYPKWPSYLPIAEDELFNGRPTPETGPYGIAKLTLFELAAAYAQQYDMKADLIIPSNLYGPGDNYESSTSHVIPSLIRKMVNVRDHGISHIAHLWGSGRQTRDFLYVKDAARGIADAVDKGTDGQPINLGSGEETTIGDVAEKLSHIIGGDKPVPYEFEKDDSGYVGSERRVLDIARARDVLGWKPHATLDVGLAVTVADYRGRWK